MDDSKAGAPVQPVTAHRRNPMLPADRPCDNSKRRTLASARRCCSRAAAELLASGRSSPGCRRRDDWDRRDEWSGGWPHPGHSRSEERRVGKEGRSRMESYEAKERQTTERLLASREAIFPDGVQALTRR